MKTIVFRISLYSRKKIEKDSLIRIYKTKDETISIDKNNQNIGRGAYLDKEDLLHLDEIKKRRLIERSLKSNNTESIYIELENLKEEIYGK